MDVFKHEMGATSPQVVYSVLQTLVWSGVAYVASRGIIPIVARRLPDKLCGKDLCKRGTPAGDIPITESLGVASGAVYVIVLAIIVLTVVDDPGIRRMMLWGSVSILSMLTLGFIDDLFDLRWRYKLIFPPLATLPLLLHYRGLTTVLLPSFTHSLFASNSLLHSLLSPHLLVISDNGDQVELGAFYYLFMVLITVFSTNAINIYAGVNGLEAGQTVVIAFAIVIQNFVQIVRGLDYGGCHLLSLFFMLPFLGSTLGLLHHNWYPARVFVGDTFCYYSGMALAVAAVLGHFPKTYALFVLPQILNFLYSIPQLFKIVPCPRHRLPKYDKAHDKMVPSTVTETSTKANMTLINLALEIFGPLHEKRLVIVLLAFQALACVFAFWIRFGLSSYFYDFVH